MTPFFSIIIPVYNVAPYLRECLDSVLAQTFTDWEAICVDDGSTDGSGTILDEYVAKDKRFKVVHQANAGVGSARNKGLDIAKGGWILFLDADDLWRYNLLATVLTMIKAFPSEKLFRFSYEYFTGEFYFSENDVENIGCKVVDISKKISMHDFFFFFFICYVYSRDLFEGIRFPRYIRGEDRCVLNKIQLERANSIVSTDSKLYGYRNREGSAMRSTPSVEALRDEMDHRLDIMEMIDASGKKVDYAGNYWLEGYFIHTLPLLMLDRPDDAREIKAEWRKRLPRLLKCKGLSQKGRKKLYLSRSQVLRPIGDFILYMLPRLRHRSTMFKSFARLYRRIMRHGEFARE